MTLTYQPSQLDQFYTFARHKFKNPEDVSVIFDIGSLHCLESIQFSQKFPNSQVYAFEANSESYKTCLENTKEIDNIQVINKAVNSYDGVCTFRPINPEKTVTTWFDGNRGASSLFKANGVYDHIEQYVQDEVEVPCIRLDTFCSENNIDKVDLIWMDLQGAELIALQSLGNILETVQVIHTELEINPMYEDQCLFTDVNEFLKDMGFMRVYGNPDVEFGTDFIFVNKRK